jgi:hypothetical protein
LAFVSSKKIIKIKQAFKNIQQPRTLVNISSGKSSSFNGNLAHAQQISQLFRIPNYLHGCLNTAEKRLRMHQIMKIWRGI